MKWTVLCVTLTLSHLALAKNQAPPDQKEVRGKSASSYHKPLSCLEFVCKRLGKWKCDERAELDEVAAICLNTSPSCLAFTCQQLGDWQCDEVDEIREAANYCKN